MELRINLDGSEQTTVILSPQDEESVEFDLEVDSSVVPVGRLPQNDNLVPKFLE